MNAYGNLHNSLSTDFETETLNHYTVALPTDYTRYYTNNYYIPITQNLQITCLLDELLLVVFVSIKKNKVRRHILIYQVYGQIVKTSFFSSQKLIKQ
jgi:hypothetical protein